MYGVFRLCIVFVFVVGCFSAVLVGAQTSALFYHWYAVVFETHFSVAGHIVCHVFCGLASVLSLYFSVSQSHIICHINALNAWVCKPSLIVTLWCHLVNV